MIMQVEGKGRVELENMKILLTYIDFAYLMTVSKYEGQKQKTETLRNRFFTRSPAHQSPTFELQE